MQPEPIVTGILLDEVALTVDELALACTCERDWIVERIEWGLLESLVSAGEWRFASAQLVRARRLLAIERDFDANPELAALTVDLIEEVESLRRRLG